MPKSTNCLVPEGGYCNHDGYIRVLNKPRKCGGRLVMLHRLEWEKVNGPIKEGYEINHICKNRRCCNTNHLELLTTLQHRIKDNQIRYKKREYEIVVYLNNNPTKTQVEVAKEFNLTQPAISKIWRKYYYGT